MLKDILVDGAIGTAVGAAVGTVSASAKKESTLSALVRDAIAAGQIVLVVQTRSKEETAMAREVIQTAVGQSQDVAVTSG